MKALLALLLALPGRAADFQGGPARLPEIAAPVSPASGLFPLETGEQFFAGAKKIVDLGGEPVSRWTRELGARVPGAQLHLVNLKPDLLPDLPALVGVPNLRTSQYDFFHPPEGHPTGDRVLLNSPHFGGIYDDKQAAEVAELVDRHLEPGGLFYAHADDMFFSTLHELSNNVLREIALAHVAHELPAGYPTLSELLARRERAVFDALVARFGRENVSRRRLKDYDRGLLNAGEKYTYQVRKPE